MKKKKYKIDPIKSLQIILCFNFGGDFKIVDYSEDLKYITVIMRRKKWFLPSEYIACKFDRVKNKIIDFEYENS